MLSTLIKIAIYAPPLILAITLHEAAHAYAARRFGDDTAYRLGRMTLNPLKHIDPIWTILVPIITLLFSPFVFGAAKAVPINTAALRHPKRDMIWVAAAGPAANLTMMVGWAVIGKLSALLPAATPVLFLAAMAKAGMLVNAILMIFNLFPLLPLDGGRIVAGLLPSALARPYSRLEPFGMPILVILIVTGAMSHFLWPLVDFAMNTLYYVLGIA